MRRIAVIGGGISGLAAAFRLEKHRSAGIDYVLFESGPRFGGVIRTEQTDGCLIEAGPDSFLTEKPWAADLCRDLGLSQQLIGSNDAERKTYILVNGRLVPLPDGLMFMVPTKLAATFFSPLFSWHTKARMVREWFIGPTERGDETVAEFVGRHYGREMVQRVADPLLAGVYGGAAEELSVQAVLPRFAEIEARQGSLGRAMVATRKLRPSGQPPPLFTSLKDGMQQLTDALLAGIPPASRRTDTRVETVKPESGKWLVVSNGRTEEFDGVVFATPAYSAAEIIALASRDLAQELSAIRYSSSVTVTLAFDRQVRAILPEGFGFLVPRTEKRRLLAVTFVHNKFPHRAPADRALVRCFLGGSRDEEVLDLSDNDLHELVRRELQQILGISAAPLFARIYRWRKAMAVYTVSHKERVARIRRLIAAMPGFALAGNAYAGIGVPDCVRSGSEAASKVLADLAVTPDAMQRSS